MNNFDWYSYEYTQWTLVSHTYQLSQKIILKAELQHAVYTCEKSMRFQSQQGQTKIVFDNQGKNATQCDVFSFWIFQFKKWKCLCQKFQMACVNAA